MPEKGSILQRLLIKPDFSSTEDKNYIYFFAYKFGAFVQIVAILFGVFSYYSGITLNYVPESFTHPDSHFWANILEHILSVVLYWPTILFATIFMPIIIAMFHINIGFPDQNLHAGLHGYQLEQRQSLPRLFAAIGVIFLALFFCLPWLLTFLQGKLWLLDSATYVVLFAVPITLWIALGSYYALAVILIDVVNAGVILAKQVRRL